MLKIRAVIAEDDFRVADIHEKFLKNFDEDWHKSFKISISNAPNHTAWMTSLQSLVDARNDFAHGGNPSASIGDVITYYQHSKDVIEALDSNVV